MGREGRGGSGVGEGKGGKVALLTSSWEELVIGVGKARAAHCENKKTRQAGSLHVARPQCHPNARFPKCCRTAVHARSHAHANMHTHAHAHTNAGTYARTHTRAFRRRSSRPKL